MVWYGICIDQFSAVRRSTEAVIETLFTFEGPNPDVSLCDESVQSIFEFKIFNNLLQQAIDVKVTTLIVNI